MKDFIFENLDVYKKSLALSIEFCRISVKFPFHYGRIKDQVIGAFISIPLNIAEGSGRETSKDKINFYKIARGSSFECIPLIEICLNLGLISELKAKEYRENITDIAKMLNGLIKYQKSKS